jgi:hypothetical protein
MRSPHEPPGTSSRGDMRAPDVAASPLIRATFDHRPSSHITSESTTLTITQVTIGK